ncbi:hypothetical protein [Cobetia sp. 29-18-1]|uniref:hypothetical protein n=1 Tax=Cobetia sp. 29-18-1 TaxID=3040018 RepID=UPI002449F150|nr:hypothetical protein [Cobetia sp. 29-18-1]MDH2297229.1 hypothetical protein [Cobetia sp. 29-18-1]
MKIIDIYTASRFNPERSILREQLGGGYVVQTCAVAAENYCFEVSQSRHFILGFEVAGARSAEFLSIITEDYVFQHPGFARKRSRPTCRIVLDIHCVVVLPLRLPPLRRAPHGAVSPALLLVDDS